MCGCGGMVDATDSNSVSARSVGSSPTTRTNPPQLAMLSSLDLFDQRRSVVGDAEGANGMVA